MNTEDKFNVINSMFRDNPNFLVRHHIDSYDLFFKEKLKEIDKNEFEAKKFVSFKDRFQLFLLIALVVICIDFFVLETRTKWIKKMNLFNEN